MWCPVLGSDAEAGEVLRERVGRLHRPAVVVPPGGCPDLGVVARTDDDGFAVQAGPARGGSRE